MSKVSLVHTLSIAEKMTQNQIAFAEGLLDPEIKTDAEAYRIAYPNSKMTGASLSAEASKMRKHPKIIEYMREVTESQKDSVLHNAKTRKVFIEKKLLEEMERDTKGTTPNSRLKAMELYMKMHDILTPKEKEKDVPKTYTDILDRLMTMVEKAENRKDEKEIKGELIKKN